MRQGLARPFADRNEDLCWQLLARCLLLGYLENGSNAARTETGASAPRHVHIRSCTSYIFIIEVLFFWTRIEPCPANSADAGVAFSLANCHFRIGVSKKLLVVPPFASENILTLLATVLGSCCYCFDSLASFRKENWMSFLLEEKKKVFLCLSWWALLRLTCVFVNFIWSPHLKLMWGKNKQIWFRLNKASSLWKETIVIFYGFIFL